MPIRIAKAPRVPSRKARNFMFAPLRFDSGKRTGLTSLGATTQAGRFGQNNSGACRSAVLRFVVSHSEPVLRAITAATRPNGSSAMRFMYIVTSSQPMRGPTPALMEAMAKLADREIKAGRMIDSGGLMPVSMGAQVRITDSKLSVVDGPFVETKEMIGGYAIFELRDKEEAVAAAREFMQLHLDHMPGWDGTCEVRSFATPGVDGACEVNVRAHA